MAGPQSVLKWTQTNEAGIWNPTTLDRLGKSEEFLEELLADSPQLLEIESRRTGVRSPFRAFRQLALPTPSGRTIYPDITFLTASGHLVAVEVKRHENPELRDRSVIAQIVDYASAFSSLSPDELIAVFTGDSDVERSWGEFIESLFPDDPSIEELADELLSRIGSGHLNLVIACDKIPVGLPEIVAGVAAQSTLGFDLDLVEVAPFVATGSTDGEILFVPTPRLATKIVSRTAITITYREGDAKPATLVETTSIEEIEENLREHRGRVWTETEVEEAIRAAGNPIEIALLDFAKNHSHDGMYVSPGEKQSASFGFYVPIEYHDGSKRVRMAFSCTHGWNVVYIYRQRLSRFVAPELETEFLNRLRNVFGDGVDLKGKDLGIHYDLLGDRIDEFCKVLLWLKDQMSAV